MQQIIKDDELLIKEFIAGNRNSIEILIKRHEKKVFSYIFYLVKNQEKAEDIFQDTFLKVIHTLKSGNYKEKGKFIHWVMRIAHNLVIDSFRHNKKYNIIDPGEEVDVFKYLDMSEPSIEDKIIKSQIDQEVRSLINKLPPEQKEVLIMRHYCDMSFKEIAERANISINTALGRMRYAIINMRKFSKNMSIALQAG